jgi:DUF971 family protein
MSEAPTEIRLKRAERVLVVTFADGAAFELPCEYLRVHSPSAEVRGHGLPEPLLVTGKAGVGILKVEPVGNYAVKLTFDDGHDSGLYSWRFLRELGEQQAENMRRYRERVAAASAKP